METALPTFNANSIIELDLVNANTDNHNSGLMRKSIALIRDIENQIKRARLSGKWIVLIELILNLGDVYVNIRNYEKANHVYSEAIHLSRQIGDSGRYRQATYKLVQMFDISTGINKSLSYLFHYLDESKKLGDRQKICETYYNISKLYAIIGNEELYLKYCKYYSIVSRELNPNDILSKALDEMDLLWTILNKKAKSTNYYVSNTGDISTQAKPMNFDQTLNPICSWHDCNLKGIQFYHMKKFGKSMKIFFRNFPRTNYCDKIAPKMEFSFRKAESFVKIGSCLRELNQLQDAVSYFKKILDLEDDLFTTMNKFSAYCQLEICYQRMLENADEYTEKKLEMMASREWSLIPKYNLADIYYFSGYYREALEIYSELGIHKSHNEEENFLVNCKIGHIYFAVGQIDNAFQAYQKTKMMNMKSSEKVLLGPIFYNLYQIHRARFDWESAREELNNYLSLSNKIGDNFGKCMGYERMSDLLKVMKIYKEAYEFAKKHLEFALIIKDKDEIMCAEKNVKQLNRFIQGAPMTF